MYTLACLDEESADYFSGIYNINNAISLNPKQA